MAALTIDGTDVESLGCYVESWSGDLAPALDRPPSAGASLRLGERATGAGAVVPPRSLSVKLNIVAASASAVATVRDAVLSLAAGVTSGTASGGKSGAVTAIIGSVTARQYTVYLAANTSAEWMPAALAPGRVGATLTLVFTALDPLSYDATATTTALSTTIARTACGTAPTWPVITLAGPFTSRVVTYKDGADVTRGTFTIAGTVLSGESVVIDCDAESVAHVVSGVSTAANTWLTAGDFFALDPAHIASATNPGLVLSAGTGSVTFRRAYR